jgi:tRNA pseudouridine38-40 synthase
MSQFALKLGYLPDSSRFSGFSHQIHDPTNIYTIVRQALIKARLIHKDSQVNYASRTDRGVGAISQVLSFSSLIVPIIPEINSYLPPSIRVIGSTQVSNDFNPRKDALERSYSYFLVVYDEFDLFQAKQVIKCLIGTHDFRNFAKIEPRKPKNTVKTITNASLTEISQNTFQIQISSRSFLWQQIRRIIGHLIQVATSEMTPVYTAELLETEIVNKKPSPAPPEPLILENIKYEGIQFMLDKKGVESFQQQLEADIMTYTSQLEMSKYISLALSGRND